MILPLAATLALIGTSSLGAQADQPTPSAPAASAADAGAQSAASATPAPQAAASQGSATTDSASAAAASASGTAASSAPPAIPAHPITAHERRLADRAYDRGLAHMRERRYEDAARDFATAIQQDPSRPSFYQALSVAQEARVTGLLQHAAQERSSNPAAADRLLAQARGIDPANPRVLQHDTTALPSPLVARPALQQLAFVPAGAIVPQVNRVVHTFHESTDTRAFAAELGSIYGLRLALDPDLQSRSFRVDLDDADYNTAMNVFGMVAGVFPTPLDEHSILIAADTEQNRKRFEHLLEETVPLPGYSAEQINEVGTMLRTVFELPDQKQVQSSPLLNALVIRAPEDTLHAMDAVLADLIDSSSEVTVDVKLYSVDSSKVRNLGVTLPTSFTLFSARSEIQNVLNSNASLIQQLIANGALPAGATGAQIAAYLVFVAGLGNGSILQNTLFLFGGGLSALTSGTGSTNSFGVTPIGVATASFPALNFALQTSQAVALDDLQLRVADRQTAIFKAGSRYPIQTAIFSDIATGTNATGSLSSLLSQYLGSSAASALTSVPTIPQFQYEDIGLTVNATPRVMNREEVALKLEVKISALSGNSINGIPILASRDIASSLSLRDGETVVMTSHVADSEAAAVTGIPGLNSIPGLRNLTDRTDNDSHTTLVLLVTPHIVRHSHDLRRGPYVPVQNRPDNE
ncbi:hypothetical protein [Terriglobus aquaticus]|uniref:Type II/III secretion system secretin-like domain-containing protein n=2 Tax=Terriglobus aquaticus TaxID=940139 RepID=A0ABW9KMB3_9BACT